MAMTIIIIIIVTEDRKVKWVVHFDAIINTHTHNCVMLVIHSACQFVVCDFITLSLNLSPFKAFLGGVADIC